MHIHNLSNTPSVLNSFVSEIRDKSIQKDSMRFRRNIERIGEILGYELSKSLQFETHKTETPLGGFFIYNWGSFFGRHNFPLFNFLQKFEIIHTRLSVFFLGLLSAIDIIIGIQWTLRIVSTICRRLLFFFKSKNPLFPFPHLLHTYTTHKHC